MFSVCVALTAILVGVVLFGEHAQDRRIVWFAKPLASLCFIAAALSRGALDSLFGQAVLVALLLSFAGDVLLIPHKRIFFLAGLATFLLGHLAFGASFLIRGADTATFIFACSALMVPAAVVWRWLRARLDPKMRVAVPAYIAAITAMVSLACATAWEHSLPTLVLGALAFYASDLLVARDRFIGASFSNKLWGLPLYYAAQLLFAGTV